VEGQERLSRAVGRRGGGRRGRDEDGTGFLVQFGMRRALGVLVRSRSVLAGVGPFPSYV